MACIPETWLDDGNISLFLLFPSGLIRKQRGGEAVLVWSIENQSQLLSNPFRITQLCSNDLRP